MAGTRRKDCSTKSASVDNLNARWDGLTHESFALSAIPDGYITTQQYADRYGLTQQQARYRLHTLHSAGKVDKIQVVVNKVAGNAWRPI